MILDGFPANLQPIVSMIDERFTNRRLALVFEARVGKSRIVVTSIHFDGTPVDPNTRQLHASLRSYAPSDAFKPQVNVPISQIRQRGSTAGTRLVVSRCQRSAGRRFESLVGAKSANKSRNILI